MSPLDLLAWGGAIVALGACAALAIVFVGSAAITVRRRWRR